MLDDPVNLWMTQDPIIIGPDTTLPEAYKLMSAAKIRRLPVVEEEKLIGIITLGDICEASPFESDTVSILDINFELASLTVARVMSQDLITIPADTTVRQAANIILDRKVGGLPVMKGEKLVGIITESDIFRLLVTAEKVGEDSPET